MTDRLSIVECPRDAMQGWKSFIPTELKIRYLNTLLKCGFDVLDFGSFVSPKAIPQMADTADVLAGLDLSDTKTRLLAIIANTRGAEDAVSHSEIAFLGFPFSISETFQLRNTNKTIAASLLQVEEIQNRCLTNGKELVVYISMGFGNPYGDEYNAQIAIDWVGKLADMGVRTIAMSDTVGIANPETISYVFSNLIPAFPEVSIGAHFHSDAYTWKEKLDAAFDSGCRRFDSALKGIGGCPMAEDELVGNMATENLLTWCIDKGIETSVNQQAFNRAMLLAAEVFVK
ncbi:MAG: hydroxymethylglutaryl-CoA lyase [Sphingobacteriales bacterium]|nr:MAG: hydroxymethylglutaryl-CoA lyase [Sphingobacteriales bacterium]